MHLYDVRQTANSKITENKTFIQNLENQIEATKMHVLLYHEDEQNNNNNNKKC